MVRTRQLAVTAAAASAAVIAVLATSAAAAPGHVKAAGPSPLPVQYVTAPPPGATGPDDLTALTVPGLNGGLPMVWTAFQNGVGADGSPSSTGATASTVAGYDAATGALVTTIDVTGKVDGLTAYPKAHELLATVNEDNNSAFNVISLPTGAVTTYQYSPSPAVSGVGGTDSIAVHGMQIYVVHSNPSDTTQPAQYLVTLDSTTLTANLTPVFNDNATATDAMTHKPVTLALTDPDSSANMPGSAPRFASQLATVDQTQGKMIFASHLSTTPVLKVLTLTDNVPGNVPGVDGIAGATTGQGTLFVVDNSAGTITALSTAGWPAGTIFVDEGGSNPILGTLDLTTGQITPTGNTFTSPKGLTFIHG